MPARRQHEVICPVCKRRCAVTRDGHNLSRRRGTRVYDPVWRFSRHVKDPGAKVWCSNSRLQIPNELIPVVEDAA